MPSMDAKYADSTSRIAVERSTRRDYPRAMTRFERYLGRRCALDDPFVELDLSRSGLRTADLDALAKPLQESLRAIARLEAGELANADEKRMVGHYWLRAPGL